MGRPTAQADRPGDEFLRRVRPLEKHHDTSGFQCGAPDLDVWLRDYALANHLSGNARVFVVCRGESVVGYYALATAGVERRLAPEAITRGGVPQQIPCLLLARLAVDRREQGRGLGRALLVDAIRRAVLVSENVGFRALLIHARDDEAKRFYLGLAEFAESPTDHLHLSLHLKRARRLLSP